MDTKQAKERTQIFSLRDPNEKLYNYHKAINDATYEIALQNPILAGEKGELSESDGYNHSKKKSRLKQLNPGLDQSIKPVKLQGDTKRVKEVSEELTEVDKQMQLYIKQRESYSNCQQYYSAISISEKLESLRQKKRKLQTELTMLQKKQAKSEHYHKARKCLVLVKLAQEINMPTMIWQHQWVVLSV